MKMNQKNKKKNKGINDVLKKVLGILLIMPLAFIIIFFILAIGFMVLVVVSDIKAVGLLVLSISGFYLIVWMTIKGNGLLDSIELDKKCSNKNDRKPVQGHKRNKNN